jgi:shikimate dehydrogenase
MIYGKKHIKCGLIGEKLSHSFSPQIHKELSDYSYTLFEMSENEVGDFLKNVEFDATNVTIPYKKTVMPYLDEISNEAMRIGSVNTITRTTEGGLRGDNTDYYGFWHTVEKSGITIKSKKVLILGTGGASLTARTVSEDMGAENITFVSRSGEVNYDNVYEKCGDTEVIINCTPVGMYPKNGASPIILENFKACEGVIDMIYNPARTKLLLDAERLGIRHINGLPMLVAQAKRACELFLGEDVDDGEIERITALIAAQTGNIILIGMPGCGKTTVGKILSEMMGREVIDTDEMIKVSQDRSPSEIINSDGVEKFREIEHIEIENAGKTSEKIISTGGGVVTREENYESLHQNGRIVFIHRSLDKLATDDRPLSKNLEEMYEIRLPMYRRFCDIEVTNDSSPENCAKEILEKLNLI